MYLVSNVKRCKNYNVLAMSGMLRCLRVRGYAHTVLKLDLTTIIFYNVALMIFFPFYSFDQMPPEYIASCKPQNLLLCKPCSAMSQVANSWVAFFFFFVSENICSHNLF